MLADTAFGIALSAWLDANQTLGIVLWLGTGFIVGILAIKDGRCESPVATLMFATFCAPLFLIVLAPFVVAIAPFALIVWLLGIEPSQSDTHGV